MFISLIPFCPAKIFVPIICLYTVNTIHPPEKFHFSACSLISGSTLANIFGVRSITTASFFISTSISLAKCMHFTRHNTCHPRHSPAHISFLINSHTLRYAAHISKHPFFLRTLQKCGPAAALQAGYKLAAHNSRLIYHCLNHAGIQCF